MQLNKIKYRYFQDSPSFYGLSFYLKEEGENFMNKEITWETLFESLLIYRFDNPQKGYFKVPEDHFVKNRYLHLFQK